LLHKASLLAREGENEAALAIYQRLQADRPNAVWVYTVEADLRAKTGDSDGALRVLARARERCRSDAQIAHKEAGVYRQLGLLDRSLEVLTQAGAAFPGHFWLWHSRTAINIDLGLFDEAEALLKAPPTQLSDQERGYVLKLRAKLDKARWRLEPAIQTLDGAVELDPKDSAARVERAKLKLMILDLPGAWGDLVADADTRSSTSRRKANPMHSHTGQIYEEYIFDSALGDRLVALRGMPPQEQIGPLLQLVRAFPDSTCPAISLMIALRRAGRFNPLLSEGPPANRPPAIPKLITRFWNDPEPPADVARLMASWDECEPDFKIDAFNDSSAMNYLRARCAPQIAAAFRRASEPAQRADLFRLARLYHEGGFYIDADDRARGGFSAHVPPEATFFAHQEEPGSIGNNVLGATPGHPVIAQALDEATAAIQRGDRDLVWLATGPGLLTRAFALWLASEPERFDERLVAVAVPTLEQIRRVAAIHCHAGYKNTGRAWLSGAFRKTTNRKLGGAMGSGLFRARS
jgi:tetratricopeptide (TPR) repeat protein